MVGQPITDPISGPSFDFTFHVWPWAWQQNHFSAHFPLSVSLASGSGSGLMLTAGSELVVSVGCGLTGPPGLWWPDVTPSWAHRHMSPGAATNIIPGVGVAAKKFGSPIQKCTTDESYDDLCISYLQGYQCKKLPLTKFKCAALQPDSWPSKSQTQPVKLESDWWRQSAAIIGAVYYWNCATSSLHFHHNIWYRKSSFKKLILSFIHLRKSQYNCIWVYLTALEIDWLCSWLLPRSSDLNIKY